MGAKYWLKLYYEILDDPKMGKLRPATKWRFIECLLVAGERDEGGFLPDTDELAWRVRADPEQLETDLLELVKAGIIAKVDGRWFVLKFAERQGAVSGAERTARFRERQKKQEYYATETEPLRDGNETVTIRYTDTDTDTDKIQIQSAGPTVPVEFATERMLAKWQEWTGYHADRGKPLARATATRQFQTLYQWGEDRFIAALDHSMSNNYTGLVEPKTVVNGKVTSVVKAEPVYQSGAF